MDEFNVKLAPNANNKKHDVFKLHKDDQISWTETRMRRENDFQPWQMKVGGGKTARRFKAIKEGGVGDNASYFVFYKPKGKSDTYEVCPIDEWYNVSATQRYKTLTAEEAEQRFEQRHKTLNFFSVMHLKKNGEDGQEGLSSHDSKDFKVSELDDWNQSGGDDSDDDGADSDNSRKKKKKKKGVKDENDPDNVPDEAKEESDEGDFEQREVDYMSDSISESSVSEADDGTDVKGIAEEEALRDLLSTDDEEDQENSEGQKSGKAAENKSKLGMVDMKQDQNGNDSDDSSDSDDYDVDEEKMDSMFLKKGIAAPTTIVKQEIKQEPEPQTIPSTSKQQSAPENKRKYSLEVSQPAPAPKRPCPAEVPSSYANSQEKFIEDLIRKYLSRKPMTLKTLLKDIKSKIKRMEGAKPEMDKDLVVTIASIMKKLQPDKQRIGEVDYFSLKS